MEDDQMEYPMGTEEEVLATIRGLPDARLLDLDPDDGVSLLFSAVSLGHIAVMEEILSRVPRGKVLHRALPSSSDIPGTGSLTPLHEAVRQPSLAAMQLLLAHIDDEDLAVEALMGKTPLHMALCPGPTALLLDRLTEKQLVQEDHADYTPLARSIDSSLDDISCLIIDHLSDEALCRQSLWLGRSALHEAALARRIAPLDAIVLRVPKEELEKMDTAGHIPLALALLYPRPGLACIELMANMYEGNDPGRILQLAIKHSSEIALTVLHSPVSMRAFAASPSLLFLHQAVKLGIARSGDEGYVQVVQELLPHLRHETHVKDEEGLTAMDYAERNPGLPFASMLHVSKSACE